ncbi:hypothetical protein ACW5R3_01750 [Bizionia sp. KMM 8389]
MTRNIFILTTTLFLFVFSCKEKKEVTPVEAVSPTEEVVVEETSSFFSFELDAEFQNDDKIVLYYLTPDSETISKDQSIEKEVVGSTNIQTVNFQLPEDILPTRILVKFGENGEQVLKVNKVSLAYGENSIQVPDSLFNQFFKPNKGAVYNKEGYSIEAVKDAAQKPMFFSRKTLEDKIDLNFF